MVVLSKEIFPLIEDGKTCAHILHPNFKNCRDFHYFINFETFKGVFKFYLSLFLLELLVNYKKSKNKEYLKKKLESFLRNWLYGYTLGWALPAVCIYRKIIGRFYYYTTVFLPGFTGGFSIFILNQKDRVLNTILFSMLALECGANYLKGQEIIRSSVNKETIFFMLTNALFTYLYKTNSLAKEATLIWFFDPRSKEDSMENQCCEGKYKCFKHINEISLKTFAAGYAFYAAKALLGKIKIITKKPLEIIKILAGKRPLLNGLFFGSYVFIFEVISRYLYTIDMKEKGFHSLIAGLLAGITYKISPSMQTNLLPFIFIMQLLWINVRTIYKIPRWIIPEILFAASTGILFHFNFLKPEYTPNYVRGFVHSALNGHGHTLEKNIETYVKSKIIEKGIPITKYLYYS